MADVSPLDGSVNEVVTNPQYLNVQHCENILRVIRLKFPALFVGNGDPNGTDDATLRVQLKSMGDSIAKLILSATSTNNPQDMKRIFDAQKEYFKMWARFSDAVESQNRLHAIEMATMDALAELGSKTVSDRFMQILEKKLQETVKK